MRSIRTITVLVAMTLITSACHVLISDPWGPGGFARPYWCDPTDTAVNDGHGLPYFDLAYTVNKGPLSSTDCQNVTSDLNNSTSFVAQFPTVADAVAAGWKQAAVWSSGQGIHYVDPSRLSGPFDPDKPNWLMYDGTAPDSKITGMMFLLNTGTTTPPAGFPGANDHWHQHGALCTDPSPGAYPFIIGEHLSDAECSAIGGFNVVNTTVWMVHVWLPIYDSWIPTDVFNKSHPLIP